MSTPRRVLVLGATSGIAQAVARVYAAGGARLALVARSREHLAAVAGDLAVRGAEVVLQRSLDFCELDRHRTLLAEAETALAGLDVVLVAHGVLPDQQACQEDSRRAVASWDVNFVSAASLMEAAADRMAAAGRGTLGVLSSVAGERGRADNYVYGAAKAALTSYASGLGHRLRGTGVTVVTLKPGPVDTPMIRGRTLSPGLVADVDVVGRRIHRALERGERLVYVPGKWRWIMAVLRALPVRLFERLKV
jgi:short-subunit dehydrogenase